MTWRWKPEARDQVRVLMDQGQVEIVRAVAATLREIARDPGNPRLGTLSFRTAGHETIRMTPVRVGDWQVAWALVDEADLMLLAVHEAY